MSIKISLHDNPSFVEPLSNLTKDLNQGIEPLRTRRFKFENCNIVGVSEATFGVDVEEKRGHFYIGLVLDGCDCRVLVDIQCYGKSCEDCYEESSCCGYADIVEDFLYDFVQGDQDIQDQIKDLIELSLGAESITSLCPDLNLRLNRDNVDICPCVHHGEAASISCHFDLV